MSVKIELKRKVMESRQRSTAVKYNVLIPQRLKRYRRIVPVLFACLLVTILYGYLSNTTSEVTTIHLQIGEKDPNKFYNPVQIVKTPVSEAELKLKFKESSITVSINQGKPPQVKFRKPEDANVEDSHEQAAREHGQPLPDDVAVPLQYSSDPKYEGSHVELVVLSKPLDSPPEGPTEAPAVPGQQNQLTQEQARGSRLINDQWVTAEGKPTGLSKSRIACKLPQLVPLHASISELVRPPPPVECSSKEHPMLFEVDLENILVRLDDPELYGYRDCCYSRIQRKPDDDNDLLLSEDCTPITHDHMDIPETQETIMVSCVMGQTNSTLKDVDIFALPRLKHEKQVKVKRDQLNVVILGLDSMSNMNFQRTMPSSYSFLTESLGAFTFEGYTKVGENTFPNSVAALVGKTVDELKSSCWKGEQHFDSCDFIFKNYSSKGYWTVFGEDAPLMSAFNYYKSGFHAPPTDYYLRPSLLAQDYFTGHEDILNANVCYGPRLAFNVMLKYMKGLANAMATGNSRYFEWFWATTLFHDDSNMAFLGDEMLTETLRWFHEEGHLNNTILFVMSDHGMRWGSIRETLQGKIEERMPLLNIVLPTRFTSKYPQAVTNLKSNKHRLTTPFDVHQTLVDLLRIDQLNDQQISEREKILGVEMKNGSMPRGISLFLPIPLSRNCKKAHIDDHWCTCNSLKSADVNTKQAQEAAATILGHINKLLDPFPECSTLELDDITQMHELIGQGNLDYDYYDSLLKDKDGDPLLDQAQEGKKSKPPKQYEVTIRTTPGQGVFEAAVAQDENKSWSVLGAISRTNLYGKQGHCISQSDLKVFCYCG